MLTSTATWVEFSNSTRLYWKCNSETFVIERPDAQDPSINHGTEAAPHTLFTVRNEQGEETEETLRIRAIFDSSVLEVFVNERTAVSTRIYAAAERCFGVRFFASGAAKPAAVLVQAHVWDGLEA